jgi:hypothetical protein
LSVSPNVCNVNNGEDGNSKTLADEPGIPELEELYYDDNYDFKTGKFIGMSEKTKQIFESDLQIFYNIFTGKSSMPPEIKKFSEYQGKSRFSQIECIRNLKLSQTELSQLKISYTFFIERELEGIEIITNFFISQDKKNVYAPGELSKVKEHLKFKSDLYYVLNKKTEDYLFYGEDNNVNEFISIYQSLIRLQYDLLNSVSKNVRQNFYQQEKPLKLFLKRQI